MENLKKKEKGYRNHITTEANLKCELDENKNIQQQRNR